MSFKKVNAINLVILEQMYYIYTSSTCPLCPVHWISKCFTWSSVCDLSSALTNGNSVENVEGFSGSDFVVDTGFSTMELSSTLTSLEIFGEYNRTRLYA